MDCSICGLRHHTLLHREMFGASRELGVFDATNSSHVAKLVTDVQNCFAAIYVCADSFREGIRPTLSSVLGRIRNLRLINKGLNYRFGNSLCLRIQESISTTQHHHTVYGVNIWSRPFWILERFYYFLFHQFKQGKVVFVLLF